MSACANLTTWQFGECFWMIADTAEVQWPRVLIPRCEKQFEISPYVAEFFSTITALLFIVLGIVNLTCSSYSDETTDLAASVFVLNGLSAALSHGTQWRFWGQMDSVTINVMALFFTYAVLQLYLPSLSRRRFARAAILLPGMLTIVCTLVWNGHAVPNPADWEWHSMIVLTVAIVNVAFTFLLNYSRAHWHVGQIKRMLLLGTLLIAVAAVCWLVEPRLPSCANGQPMIFSLHPVWHVFVALGLNLWTCVCKYHRGCFYGFDVDVQGWLLFPRVIWTPKTQHHVPTRGPAAAAAARPALRKPTRLSALRMRLSQPRMRKSSISSSSARILPPSPPPHAAGGSTQAAASSRGSGGCSSCSAAHHDRVVAFSVADSVAEEVSSDVTPLRDDADTPVVSFVSGSGDVGAEPDHRQSGSRPVPPVRTWSESR